MNLYTNTSNLQKSLTDQVNKGKRPQDSAQIGARINASVAKDLGNGKYILNLGGSETLYVESDTAFNENEKVEVQVRSNSEGRVELKLLTRSTDQGASVNQITNSDTAEVSREVKLLIPTKDIPSFTNANSDENSVKNATQDALVKTSDQNITPPTGKTDTTSSTINLDTTGKQANVEVSTSKPHEIQLIINRSPETGEATSVKLLLPDGKLIDAELITDSSDSKQQATEIVAPKDLKEIMSSGATTSEESTEESKAITNEKSQTGSIKNLLTAVASRLFSSVNTETLQAMDKSTLAKMLINEVTIPLLFPSNEGSENTPVSGLLTSNTAQQLEVTLPFQELAKALPEILNNPSQINITQSIEGNYQLEYAGNDGDKNLLPLPPESSKQLDIILNQNQQKLVSTPIEIGVKSLLQGIIKENIKTEPPVAKTHTAPLSRPQQDQTKLDSIIIRSGMTPSTATREASSALLDNSLPITRPNIQSLLALSAGKVGAERDEFLQAGAKLLSLDAPLSPALASGINKLHTDEGFLGNSIQKIMSSLELASETTNALADDEIKDTQQQATTATTSKSLVETFTRATQTLKGIPVLIETLNTAATESSPQGSPNTEQPTTLASDLQDFVASSARERLSAVESMLQNSASTILDSDPILSKLSTALDVVLSKLGNLPEGAEETIQEKSNEATDNTDLSKLKDITKKEFLGSKETEKEFDFKELLKELPTFKSRASHPGISKVPEFWQKVEIDPSTLQNADISKIKASLEQIITAPTPERAQEITKEILTSVDRDTLRTLASTLQEVEREEIQKHPALQHIREASNELRELGRALVAQKAENLANSRNDPGSFNTSIPFNFNGDDSTEEDGQLSMFYNKSKSKKGNWQQRVILDLNMSILGNIIGDIQFHEGVINVNFVSSNKETVYILESEKDGLQAGLEGIGFKASVGVRLLIPKTETANKETTKKQSDTHLLDIKA